MAVNARDYADVTLGALTDDEVYEIREAFNLFDTEGTGTVDPREIKCAMQSLGIDKKNPLVYQIIADLDKGSHKTAIDFNEFLSGITHKMGNRDSRDGIRQIFDLFDVEGNGSISFQNLKRVANQLGENLTDDELRDMINRADSNGDGLLSFEDFYAILSKRNG